MRWPVIDITFRFSASDGYFLLATSYSITSTTTACVALAFSVGSLVNEDDSRLSTMMSHALHPLHNHSCIAEMV
ncbi:hypothetical protein AcV5_008283 [Taiwanofungus camphoratus]|nr:hypothetical protein AcV5_008283 [Antrodia cinnamomea]KAI0955679.1 hypothetical protein AcV7_006278 [Antrodia cinnamomea]